ncbi:MAG: hypothetical protein GY894_02090 [Planctomycetes bacterium]|nr:hypothetical protein [Planctomycetota bacterium]
MSSKWGAGKGVGEREAKRKARALYRERQRDPMAFVETFAQPRPARAALPFGGVAGRYFEEEVKVRLRASTQRRHEQILRVPRAYGASMVLYGPQETTAPP